MLALPEAAFEAIEQVDDAALREGQKERRAREAQSSGDREERALGDRHSGHTGDDAPSLHPAPARAEHPREAIGKPALTPDERLKSVTVGLDNLKRADVPTRPRQFMLEIAGNRPDGFEGEWDDPLNDCDTWDGRR